MKTMRRISVFFLAIVMALSLAACGGAQKTVVLRGDLSSSVGVPTTDTFTLTANGDIVKTINEVLEMDLSDYDDASKDYLIATFDSLIMEPAKSINGVTCSGRTVGNTYIIEMTIDCTGDAVEKAADAGLVSVEGDAGKISLKQTQSSLEQQGYKVVG